MKKVGNIYYLERKDIVKDCNIKIKAWNKEGVYIKSVETLLLYKNLEFIIKFRLKGSKEREYIQEVPMEIILTNYVRKGIEYNKKVYDRVMSKEVEKIRKGIERKVSRSNRKVRKSRNESIVLFNRNNNTIQKAKKVKKRYKRHTKGV